MDHAPFVLNWEVEEAREFLADHWMSIGDAPSSFKSWMRERWVASGSKITSRK
jgi:hypothetical protein